MERWSGSTRVGYGVAVNRFASCFQAESPDALVAKIKCGEVDRYEALEKYITTLAANGLAPKTIRGHLTGVKGLLRHEGVSLDDYQVRLKVGVPPNIESSLDRIPTRDELRILVLDAAEVEL